jgi:hypothetical protein
MEKHIDYYFDILSNLKPGSEVNVHTDTKTLYNAIFCKVNPKNRVAYFFIDQFYEYGNFMVPVACNEINSMDLPINLHDVLGGDITSMDLIENPQGVLEEDE